MTIFELVKAVKGDTRHGNSTVFRFLLDILRYFPASLIPAAVNIIASAVFTRTFAPTQYGAYSLCLAVSAPGIIALSAWAGQSALRFYTEYERRGRSVEFRCMVSFCSMLVGVFVSFVGLLLGVFCLVSGLGRDYESLIVPTIAMICVQSMCGIVMPVLSAQMRPTPYRRQVVFSSVVSAAISLFLVYVFGPKVQWLLWGQVIGVASTLPYVYRQAGIPFFHVPRMTPRIRHLMNRISRYGFPIMAWFLAYALLSGEDRYIIQWFRGPEEVAMYSVNYGLIGGITGLINAPVMAALGPVLYAQWGQRQLNTVSKIMSAMTELYCIIAVGFLGVVVTSGHSLVAILIGEKFRAGQSILIPLYLGNMIWGMSQIGHKGLEFYERTPTMVWNAAAAVVANFVLNLLLVPKYGYIAAAYVTLISYVVYGGITWWQSRHIVFWHISITQILAYCTHALVAVISTRLVIAWLLPQSAPGVVFLLGSGVFFACYGSLLILFKRNRVRTLVSVGGIG